MVLLILRSSGPRRSWPLAISAQLVRLDIPLLVGASVLLLVLCLDGSVSVVDGSVLLAVAVGSMSVVLVLGRRQGARLDGGPARSKMIAATRRVGRQPWDANSQRWRREWSCWSWALGCS